MEKIKYIKFFYKSLFIMISWFILNIIVSCYDKDYNKPVKEYDIKFEWRIDQLHKTQK